MSKMIDSYKFVAVTILFQCVFSISTKKSQSIVNPKAFAPDDCDPSIIPVMSSFDIKKFTGKWYELAKTVSGYIDVSDGVWLINGTNTSYDFLFSGRDNNQHCIRPIKGRILDAQEPPGFLTLNYKTYSTYVEENVRVLFTDYVSVAVIYSCIHHVHTDKEVCHSAGLFGAIWTREPHVGAELYETATRYLEMACVHKSTLIIRNIKGPCRIEQWDPRIDDFPAPDYCYHVKDLGSCHGSLQRYYYDESEKTCKQFTYGGCGGNKNNFMSLTECQKKCSTSTNKDPVCMSKASCALHCSPCCTEDSNGCVQCDCEHVVEDSFLNCVSSAAQCPDQCDAELLYQGCHVCKCADDFHDGVCHEVKKTGTCKASIERYYYNADEEQCQKFTYSGCDGNNNNFQTLQECREKCTMKDIIIEHAPEVFYTDTSAAQSISILLIAFAVLFIMAH